MRTIMVLVVVLATVTMLWGAEPPAIPKSGPLVSLSGHELLLTGEVSFPVEVAGMLSYRTSPWAAGAGVVLKDDRVGIGTFAGVGFQIPSMIGAWFRLDAVWIPKFEPGFSGELAFSLGSIADQKHQYEWPCYLVPRLGWRHQQGVFLGVGVAIGHMWN